MRGSRAARVAAGCCGGALLALRRRPPAAAGDFAVSRADAGKLSHKEVEEGRTLALDFSKLSQIARGGSQVIPVCVQHADTKEVLVVAYANEEAVRHTLSTGIVTFWSTSRNELWVKGATSGDTLDFVEARVNCDQNSLLVLARPRRPAAP
eukprot:TRINITY_DN8075_c0_g1_i3.p2 TRINITY_DN8075_c0_g1~~TRINITY_DN8075_c0_g1_i3.p2  ORF type:complete len:175 (+),score=43.96 TRINITY_DN8075_c0_g1_i3:73-525(+)